MQALGTGTRQAFVTDTHCPHLGADLTAGGRVVGDCVQCPFHRWKFSGEDGRCAGVPYLADSRTAEEPPGRARLRTHRSLEANGLVYLWHHQLGEEPPWEPVVVPELMAAGKERRRWVYQGRNEFEVACHIQDIPENGADVNHLPAVHRTSIMV